MSDAETSGGASGVLRFRFAGGGVRGGDASDAARLRPASSGAGRNRRGRVGAVARGRARGGTRTDGRRRAAQRPRPRVRAVGAEMRNPVRARVLSVRDAAGKSFFFLFDGGMIDSTSNDVSRLLRSPSFLIPRLSDRLESSRVPDDASRRSSLFLRSKVFLFVRFGSGVKSARNVVHAGAGL